MAVAHGDVGAGMTADMPAAELAIDVDLVRGLLRDQHPDLADLELRAVANGWDNVVLRLGPELAVRVPRRRLGAELIESELRWLPELGPRLPLPVPVPIRVGRPTDSYPWSWSVVAWMEGADAATEPPVDPHHAARLLGSFLAALHQPAPPEAPVNLFRGVPLVDRDEITRRDIGRLPPDLDGDRVLAAWEAVLRLEPYDGPACWVHGDLHPANLVVHEGRLVGVVDFGDLTSGDPATDLVVAWTLLPSDAHATLRAAAGGIDDDAWRRGRGWALTHAVACLASSADNPTIAGFSRRSLAAVLADPS